MNALTSSLYTVVVATVWVGGLFVYARAISTLLGRLNRPPSTIARWTASARASIALGAIVGSVVLVRYAPPDTILDTASWMSSWAAIAANVLTMTVVATVAKAGARRGFDPIISDLRPTDTVPLSAALRRNRLLVVGIILSLSISVELMAAGVVPLHPAWSVITAIVLFYGVYLPFSIRLPFTSREPTPQERKRITGCYDRFGRSPPTILVSEGNILGVGAAIQGGGEQQFVVVEAGLLETTSDDELAVVLAQSDALARRGYWRVHHGHQVVTMTGFSSGILISIATPHYIPYAVGIMLTTLALMAAAGRVGQRIIFHVDQFVAEQLGAETVRQGYERRRTDVQHFNQVALLVFRPLFPEPSIERRLARLDEATSSAPPGEDSSTETGEPSD